VFEVLAKLTQHIELSSLNQAALIRFLSFLVYAKAERAPIRGKGAGAAWSRIELTLKRTGDVIPLNWTANWQADVIVPQSGVKPFVTGVKDLADPKFKSKFLMMFEAVKELMVDPLTVAPICFQVVPVPGGLTKRGDSIETPKSPTKTLLIAVSVPEILETRPVCPELAPNPSFKPTGRAGKDPE
jgi:hypothetical protein